MFTIARTITTTAIATTAAAVTYFAPAAAIPVDVPAPPAVDTVTVERPCYMARPGWNTPAGWEQPVCETEIRTQPVEAITQVRRPHEDYMP